MSARVVGFCGWLAPCWLDLSIARSAWISESFACARSGVPSESNSVYCTDRLSATALNDTVLPQLNVIIGGLPLLRARARPERRRHLHRLEQPGGDVAHVELVRSVESNRSWSESFRGWPPLNCAVGSAVPGTGSTFHWFAFASCTPWG